MKAPVKETAKKSGGETAVLAAIAQMPEPDRETGERLHAIITNSAPGLVPKTWYGFPAYADADGKVVCFFRSTKKFKERYMTLGFNDAAKLDDGQMWPISYALLEISDKEEARIADILKKAVG